MTKTRDLADLGGGFIQAGSGAVQRTVESKLQDVVSVLDFIPESEHAAIKAGTSTYDATVNIQSAITSAKRIYLPAGTYKITTTLRIKRDKQLYGDGAGSSIISQAGDITALDANETTDSNLVRNIVIENLGINCATTSTTDVCGIRLTGTVNNVWGCTIKNVNVNGFYDGIRIDRPVLTEVNRCEVSNAYRHGFNFTGGGTSLKVRNSWGRINGGCGFLITGTLQYCTFDTNAADGNGEFGHLFQSTSSGTLYPEAITVVGCGAEANTKDGFKFEDCEAFTVNSCFSYSNTEHGFHLSGARQTVLTGCRAISNTLYGIKTSTSSSSKAPSTITVNGCKLTGNSGGRIDSSVITEILNDDNTVKFTRSLTAPELATNANVIVDSSNNLVNLGFNSQTYHWYKLNLSYTNFSAATAVTNYTFPNQIPAGSYIVDVVFQLTQEFSGGALTGMTFEIGDAGSPYNNFIPATNVFTGAGTGYKATDVQNRGSRLYSATDKALRAFISTSPRTLVGRLRASGANTNELTAGTLTVWVGFIKLP